MAKSSDKPVIAVIAGTKREQRKSIHAAHYVADIGRKIRGVEIVFVDPEDYDFPGDGNDPEGKDPRYTKLTDRADAFFVVTPEYNHGYPATIKRLLDSELDNYYHKPVALAGASDGNWGGTRAVEALTMAVRGMGLVVTISSAYFPLVDKLFDESGKIDPKKEEKQRASVERVYAELIWMARTLKWGRENLPRSK